MIIATRDRCTAATAPVAAVDAIGITVSHVAHSVEFFSTVLSFEKVSDSEVTGTEYEGR